MNLPFVKLYSTASDHSLSDDTRYPTLLTTGPSPHYALAQTILGLLKLFAWTRVSLISDSMSLDPVFGTFLAIIHRTVRDILASPASGVNTLVQRIDSSIPEFFDVEQTLRAAGAHSAGLSLCDSMKILSVY